jgi:dipeptidyl aminopeptidase/acylaminoacyl peptidase
MLPAIAAAVKDNAKIDTFWYGNFERDHTRWETYPDTARYGVQYVGLRSRISILTESYSYATYKERIDAQAAFVRATLANAAANKGEIKKLIEEADRHTSDAGRRGAGDDMVPIRTTMVAAPEKTVAKGYVEETKDGHTCPTSETKDYTVELFTRFTPEATVKRPYAYVIPAPSPIAKTAPPAWVTKAAENLQRHGIRVEELREDIDLDITSYTVSSLTRASRPFQNHDLATVRVSPKQETRRITAGSLLVRTGQPLGSLAVCLLEPESGDGLTTWNYFDDSLAIDKDFPILRIDSPVALTLVAAQGLPEDRETPKPITFDLVYESDHAPNLGGSPVGGMTWLEDGEHYYQNKDGKQLKIEASTGRAEIALNTKPIAEALEKLPTIDKRTAESIANRNLQMDKARKGAIFEHANDLYYVALDGSIAVRLTKTPQREELATFSPDGCFVAFVRDNDLYVVDIATQTERALTTGGTDLLRHGKADWVYYEEVFNRNWQTYWWSPDSTHIVYYEIDSSSIRPFTIVNTIPNDPSVEKTLFPKPGDPNPRIRLFTVAIAGDSPQEVDLSAYSVEDRIIQNAGWWPDSSAAFAYITNRTQTWMDVLSFPPDGGTPKVLFRESTKAWVEAPGPMSFLKDGSFLFHSERSGWKHFYHYGRDGKLIAPITAGDWEARSIARLDEEHGWVYISGTKDSHIAENLYRAKLDGSDAAEPQRLTQEPGAHRADVSPKGNYFIDSWSSTEQPPLCVLRKMEDQSIVRWLDTNPVRDLDKYIVSPVELVQIQTSDGFQIEGSIMKPPDFNPTSRYPVWFMTYGGPQAPTVSNSWGGGRTGDQVLAQQGIVVFRADPRSASAKGAVSAWSAYKQLGIQELADIETAIKWLNEKPWIDATHVGMSGFSYGGFMTSFMLTHSKLFAAGIAGGSVTDWRDYDSIYTERYMLTPQENKDGYEKTSVVAAAKNLHGHILIVHGMMDDNVHMQNSTRLIRALENAGKPFEMLFYPENRHGVGGKHWNRAQNEFILRTLGLPARMEKEDEGSPEPAPLPRGRERRRRGAGE